MRLFEAFYSGDFLDATGKVATGYCGEDLLQAAPHVRQGFFLDQSPVTLGAAYGEMLYRMQMEPHHVAAADGIVLIRPYVRASTFAQGAKRAARADFSDHVERQVLFAEFQPALDALEHQCDLVVNRQLGKVNAA